MSYFNAIKVSYLLVLIKVNPNHIYIYIQNKAVKAQKLKLTKNLTVLQKISKQCSIQKTYTTRGLLRRPTGKRRITECYNIHRRNYENFENLRETIEKSIRHQSDPNGNIINLTKHSFTKAEYKLLNKNLNFIPTPKVYNKNELDADLNDFFRRIKLKAYFKDTPNNKNDDENRLFKQNKNKKWTPPNNHHTINTYVEAVKKDIEQSKTVPPKKIRSNLSKDEKVALKDLSKRDEIIITNANKGGAVVIMDANDYT